MTAVAARLEAEIILQTAQLASAAESEGANGRDWPSPAMYSGQVQATLDAIVRLRALDPVAAFSAAGSAGDGDKFDDVLPVQRQHGLGLAGPPIPGVLPRPDPGRSCQPGRAGVPGHGGHQVLAARPAALHYFGPLTPDRR